MIFIINSNASRFASAVMPYGMFGERPPEAEEGDSGGAASAKAAALSSGRLHSMMGVNASTRGVSGRDASLAGTMKAKAAAVSKAASLARVAAAGGTSPRSSVISANKVVPSPSPRDSGNSSILLLGGEQAAASSSGQAAEEAADGSGAQRPSGLMHTGKVTPAP